MATDCTADFFPSSSDNGIIATGTTYFRLPEGNLTIRGTGSSITGGGAGSVLVTGNINAGSLDITSGGSFVLSGDGWTHIGGSPRKLYEDIADNNE